MFRIRRRFAVILCGAFLGVLLTLYFIINFSVPAYKQEPNFSNIENKLQQLENDLHAHSQKMGHLEEKLEHFENKNEGSQMNKPKSQSNINIIEEEQTVCSISGNDIPDIQMLNLYHNLSFTNIDGGVWKQGWNIKYDPLQFNEHHKLKVFVVPHSHNDPGWIKTFDDYYDHDTKPILSNMLRHLKENPDMKFIWAEISYFSRFFESLGEKSKNDIRKLVQNHQLEFVTGGWVMPDEANSHWYSVLMQLTEGQTWLKRHLNVTPISSWSIDPFGHSPTLPYVLKKSGFENLLIQRTHYSVKKRLAEKRQLEFRWRQYWDSHSETDLFTHMMPFYSYDIPHTCGPDPKICCQFDFRRIPGLGLTCPWRVSPVKIDEQNIGERAELIVDQWKKKSELYQTKSVLIPLGDDFRYSQSIEWDAQRQNYELLFEYINSERKFFTEAKFATLQEYFDSVRNEKTITSFPALSGDFFTYADRDDHYWSGYYTSRPYHKRMDRVLLHYIHSAEMLYAWNTWDPALHFDKKLEKARRELSLFQHHDGITGTAKTHVVQDYAHRMKSAIGTCKFVMQQAVYRLMTRPTINNPDFEFTYFHMDDSNWPGPEDSRTTIILGKELPTKYVVFHNSLPQWREEVVEFHVSKFAILVTDFEQNPMQAQVAPVWTWNYDSFTERITPQASTTKYRLLFKVRVPPLGIVTYIIQADSSDKIPSSTKISKNSILSLSPHSVNVGQYPLDVEFGKPDDISIHVEGGPVVSFNQSRIKSIQLNEDSPIVPIHVDFLKYGTRVRGAMSGAYLFLPDGPAVPIKSTTNPITLVVEGPLETSITTGMSFVVHQTVLRGNSIEIRNLVDIGTLKNTEIVMRLSTHIKNNDTFYTDLNGLQIIKRKRFSKLPIQANFYPIPSSIYIEDDSMRLTVVGAQPLGGTSLASGQIEIVQDRRLDQDDERGLGQGVLDNQPVLHIFRIILEKINKCQRLASDHPGGSLTLPSFKQYQSLLNPLDKFIYIENDWVGVEKWFGADHEPVEDDVQIVAIRDLSEVKGKLPNKSTGIVVHRTNLMKCISDEHRSGLINLKQLLKLNGGANSVYSTTLTFLQRKKQILLDEFQLCPMDTMAFTFR